MPLQSYLPIIISGGTKKVGRALSVHSFRRYSSNLTIFWPNFCYFNRAEWVAWNGVRWWLHLAAEFPAGAGGRKDEEHLPTGTKAESWSNLRQPAPAAALMLPKAWLLHNQEITHKHQFLLPSTSECLAFLHVN